MLIKLAWRELKNNFRFVFSFIITLLVGLLGLSLVLSVGHSIQDSIMSRSKEMLAADIEIEKNRPFSDDEIEKFEQNFSEKIEKKVRKLSTLSMVSFESKKQRKSKLLRLIAIEGAFPFYGHLSIREKNGLDKNLLGENLKNSHSVWVSQDFFKQFDLKLEDKLYISGKSYTITGVVEESSSSIFNGAQIAPIIYMHYENLARSKLISFGTTADHSIMLKLQKNSSGLEIKEQLEKLFENPAIKIRTPENAGQRISRVLTLLKDYLALASLLALFLSLIGLSFSLYMYLIKKEKDIGILKTLGLTQVQIVGFFLIQLAMIVFLCNFLNATISAVILPFLERLLRDYYLLDIAISYSWYTFSVVFFISMMTLFLLSIPLLRLFSSREAVSLLSQDKNREISFKDKLFFLPLVLSFYPLAIWMAKSIKIGSLFYFATLICTVLASLLVAYFFKLMNHSLNKTGRKKFYKLPAGLSLRYLIRNSTSATLAIMSIALGLMLIVVQIGIESSLLFELEEQGDTRPSLFLFDLQGEQLETFKNYMGKQDVEILQLGPMIRAKLEEVNGKAFKRYKSSSLNTREEQRRSRMRNRGVNLSFKYHLNSSETIIKGKWWPATPISSDKVTELSLEKRYARRMGLELGDKLVFDVLGIKLKARVTSIRKIRWTSFLPNFFMILRPGLIDSAPKMYVVALGPMKEDKKNRLIVDLAENFPNVSQVDVRSVIEKISLLFNMLAASVKLMAIFTALVGFVILFSIFRLRLRERIKDVALLRVLGLEHKIIQKVFWQEFFFLLIMACVIGPILGVLLCYFIVIHVMEISWSFPWTRLLLLFLSVSFIAWPMWQVLSRSILKQKLHSFLAE